MDPAKAIRHCSHIHLILFVTCVFIQYSSVQSSESIPAFTRAEKSVWFDRKRVRRSSTCPGNKTIFLDDQRAVNCFYDHACFQFFSDCCSDYTEKCGEQKSNQAQWSASMWKCFETFDPVWPCIVGKVSGAWMIYKCPADTNFDELREKCENPPLTFSYPVEDYIPVVGNDSAMYRNKHCALCNGVESYTSWNVRVQTYVVPPGHLDLDSRLKFIEQNGGFIEGTSLEKTLPRRYCYGKNFVDKCNLTSHPYYKPCAEGPVEVVTSCTPLLYFKNKECANCTGYHTCKEPPFLGNCGSTNTEAYSVVFKLKNSNGKPKTNYKISKQCPYGTVYDTTLKFCRTGYSISSSGKLANEFSILLWLKSHGRDLELEANPTQQNDLKSTLSVALSFQFSLLLDQISAIAFHKQFSSRDDYFAATFRLTLTHFQTLIMSNQDKSKLNVTSKNTAFLGLFHFRRNFTFGWKEYNFSVVNLVSKQLSCYGGKKFQSHEYKIDRKNGSFVVNKTGDILQLKDYSLIKENGGNVTLCRKLVLSGCKEGAYVPLSPHEYILFRNLTVYHKATNRTFKFGEYLMSNNRNNDTSNATQNSKNTTIAVCLRFNTTFMSTETKYTKTTKPFGLQILTIIGFSVSTICHVLLLVTYGLFQELRNVSGLNMMNLSFILCLSQVIWLVGTTYFQGTIVCKVFAILLHHLAQASFLAMSVISHHTFHVFSRPFTGRFANISRPRFIKYSIFVWVTPAVFVAICVTLDKTRVFVVEYGTHCWLGTANAKLYLFLLPLAIQLLFNIGEFIRTAVSLSRHDKERQALHIKKGKQNLLICMKLATLVGFPWLFAFLGALFPDVEAFEYLFVIFVCLQGLYVAMAFLFTKKILKLYKDRWNNRPRVNTPQTSGKDSFGMKAH